MDGGIGEEISSFFCTTKTFQYHNCYLRVHIHSGRNAATIMQECGRNAASPMTPQNHNFSRSKSLLSKKTTANDQKIAANS